MVSFITEGSERPLLRSPASVDHQLAAGDERGFVRSQVEHAVGYFLRLAVPAERDAREHAAVHFRLRAAPLGHRRDDRAWVDRVGPDAIARVLERGQLRQDAYGALGRLVLRAAVVHPDETQLRGDVD